MASVQPNVSKKSGKIMNYKWTALIGRDEHDRQIRLTKRVDPFGFTPAKELKEQKARANEWEKEARAEYEKEHGASAEEKLKARKDRERITLEDFIDEHWIKRHVKNGKHTPQTVAFYTNMADDIKAYLQKQAPGIKLSQFSKGDVLDYLSYIRIEGKTKKGEPYSQSTLKHYFSTLRNILRFAVYIDFLPEDPCQKIKPEDKPTVQQKEIDALDCDAAMTFIACLDSEAERAYWEKNHGSLLAWKCLVNTFILTGLRRGELVGLQWGDLDVKKRYLYIRRNVTIDTSNKAEKDPAKKIHVGTPKGKDSRMVPISKFLCDLLLEYKAEQEMKFGASFLPNAFIFCRTNDLYLPMYPTEPTRLMRKYIKRNSLPNMSPHDLRHTAATLAIESGAGVKQIQGLLGHKDPSVTLKFYARLTERAQLETVDGVEELLRPTQKKETVSVS